MNIPLLLLNDAVPDRMLIYNRHPFGDCLIAHPVIETTTRDEFCSWACDQNPEPDVSDYLTETRGWTKVSIESTLGRALGALCDGPSQASIIAELGYPADYETANVMSEFLNRWAAAETGLQDPFARPIVPCYLVLSTLLGGSFWYKQTAGMLAPLRVHEDQASWGVIPDTSESHGKSPTLCACLSQLRFQFHLLQWLMCTSSISLPVQSLTWFSMHSNRMA